MGWKFRKSVRILPGVRLNFGKKEYTSTTVGGKYFKTNYSKKGVKHTVTIPGTGISYPTETQKTAPREPRINNRDVLYWYCKTCYVANQPNAKICRNCGGDHVPNLQTIKQEDKQMKRILIGGLLLIFAAIIALTIWFV